MITLQETKNRIAQDPQYWEIHFANFLDDFRRHRSLSAIAQPLQLDDRKLDALLASTAEALCDESGLKPPSWLAGVPECVQPYFVGEIESLKAISIVESPLRFRMRKIFVLENFLSRV
ncbi:MAG: hypothetical protein M3R68_05625 [Acidobacteriota bacterium]|nr:hypothetical protein [Acidobacteriota bacterium]